MNGKKLINQHSPTLTINPRRIRAEKQTENKMKIFKDEKAATLFLTKKGFTKFESEFASGKKGKRICTLTKSKLYKSALEKEKETVQYFFNSQK